LNYITSTDSVLIKTICQLLDMLSQSHGCGTDTKQLQLRRMPTPSLQNYTQQNQISHALLTFITLN